MKKRKDSTSQKFKTNSKIKNNVIGLFIIVLMFAFCYGVLFSNHYIKVKNIAKWRSVEQEIKYAFELQKILHLKETEQEITSKDIFNNIYENKTEKIQSKNEIKNYKYRFLNGQKVKKSSEYYIKKIYELEPNFLLGFSELKSICTDNEPCGKLFVDINGKISPNRFGEDIFGFDIYKSKIEVFGYGVSKEYLKKDCQTKGSGVYCSSYYSGGGDVN